MTVEEFLEKCRILIDSRKVDPFTTNEDTKATLDFLGYNVKAMLQEIKELERKDLNKGPCPDRSSKYSGEVWLFIKAIQGRSIYIKLKIRTIGSYEELFVMSFHL